MSQAKFKYMASGGVVKDGELNLEDYRTAADCGMSTTAFINSKYSDADPMYGSAFEQGMQNLGIRTKSDPKMGIVASSVKDILDGTATIKMAASSWLVVALSYLRRSKAPRRQLGCSSLKSSSI